MSSYQPSFTTVYPDTTITPEQALEVLRESNFTRQPRRRRSRTPRIHPTRPGLCYLHLVLPQYWDMAFRVLKYNPFAAQVRAFLDQLLTQLVHFHELENSRDSTRRENLELLLQQPFSSHRSQWELQRLEDSSSEFLNQLELMFCSRLDLHVHDGFVHLRPHRSLDPRPALNAFEVLELTPDNYEIGRDPEIPNLLTALSKIGTKYDVLYIIVALVTLFLQRKRTVRKFAPLPRSLAFTAFSVLTFRFFLTGHFLTALSQTVETPEPIWLIAKVTFLTILIPKPRGLKWIIPSCVFWNNILQHLAVFYGYQFFCSMVDINLPWNRMDPAHAFATPEQLEEMAIYRRISDTALAT